ncbi:hypothetical protein [Vreelandella venusta]|uniref:hypothetical protein n=1 Tax=Vreelandella venusta TaxID=44935 RepID=UPI00200DC1A1|nr:hypothetical protein [Halomonas venusta]UQI41919.1 hypothetical protein M3L73_06575 [Halomonas venusta]
MLANLQSKALSAGVLLLSLVAAYLYWQRVTDQRDAYQAEAERQRERAEILQEHQQWQRQQIETLSDALAERDRALTIIADDIRASTAALQQLGESDAEAREWLDSDLPAGITDWVRGLQRSADGDAVLQPDAAQPPND